MGRPDVVCTPHLGASTVEAQEGVSLEIAQAVIDALKVLLLRWLVQEAERTQNHVLIAVLLAAIGMALWIQLHTHAANALLDNCSAI